MNHVFLATWSKKAGSLRLCNAHFSAERLCFDLHCTTSAGPPFPYWSALAVALSQDVNLHS